MTLCHFASTVFMPTISRVSPQKFRGCHGCHFEFASGEEPVRVTPPGTPSKHVHTARLTPGAQVVQRDITLCLAGKKIVLEM